MIAPAPCVLCIDTSVYVGNSCVGVLLALHVQWLDRRIRIFSKLGLWEADPEYVSADETDRFLDMLQVSVQDLVFVSAQNKRGLL